MSNCFEQLLIKIRAIFVILKNFFIPADEDIEIDIQCNCCNHNK
jgi:hypothetical protein